MSHLLAVSIGPVQEFVAAAQEPQDLWFGSYLLSEVSQGGGASHRPSRRQAHFPGIARSAFRRQRDPGRAQRGRSA